MSLPRRLRVGAQPACLTAVSVACRIVDAWLATELGEGWEPPIQEFIATSMAEIPELDFSPAAAAKLAAAAAEGRPAEAHARPAGQGGAL